MKHRLEIERRKAVAAAVDAELGDRIICDRCRCTLASFGERCSVGLADRCQGFEVIDEVRSRKFREIYNMKPAVAGAT